MGKKSERPEKPNDLLRYERERRGLSQKGLAELLGTDPSMISRWEHGIRGIEPFYQEKLCKLFEKDAIELGFIKSIPARTAPEAVPTTHTIIFVSPQTHAIDTLLAASQPEFYPSIVSQQGIDNTALPTYSHIEREQQLSVTLLLGAGYIAPLLDEGWSPEDILHTLSSLTKVVQAMPIMSRQQFLRNLLAAGAAAFVGGIPDFSTEKHLSVENRVQLHQALSESIASGWKLFHTASTTQTLAVGKAQLALVQQNHALLHPQARSMFYSSTHNLIGRALHLQERYEEALGSHINAHVAAMSSGDPVNVVQCLICQADTYQALGQYSKAVEVVEEALRIIRFSTDSIEHSRLKAHLLGCWADNAMQMRNYNTAQRKLDEAATGLEHISSNEEFDKASWLQLAAKNALMAGDPTTAIRYCEEAFSELPPNWVVRVTGVIVPLAIAYARIGERDASLKIAREAIPVLGTMAAPMSNKHFAEYIQKDLRPLSSSNDKIILEFVQDVKYQLPQVATLIG